MTGKPLTGRTVFFIFAGAFGVIIAVNLVLAVSAVRTFPGLEVRNSYVASQSFDADRAAQEALGWSVAARAAGGVLTLDITDAQGRPADVAEVSATVGRPTHVDDDVTPDFTRALGRFTEPIALEPGRWDLRLQAVAADGTEFRQRFELMVEG